MNWAECMTLYYRMVMCRDYEEVLDGYSSAVRALSALVPLAELPLVLGTVALLCCSGTQLCQGRV